MNAAEYFWKKSVAGHREPNARLPNLKDEQRRDHAHQRANQDDQAQIRNVQLLERIDDRSGIVRQGVPANQSSKYDHHADIQQRANDERSDDAARQVALRIVALFGGGGDRIKSDVSEKHNRATGKNSRPTVRRERMPIRSVNEARCESDECENGDDLDQHHDVVGFRGLADSAD